MGGPGLEVFKFVLYLVMPVAAMVHYGKPEWYTTHVLPYRERIFPPIEKTNRDLPVDQAALKAELQRIMAEKRVRRAESEMRGKERDSGLMRKD